MSPDWIGRYDVLIVGGGLVGCATAFHLARAGASVLVVERRQINAGASGQNAGSLHFQLERRLIEHGDVQTAQAAKMMRLHLAAISDWSGLQALLGDVDLEVVMAGGLMVAETPAEMAHLERKAAYERGEGLRVDVLDATAALSRAPYLSPAILGAAFCPDEGHANPRTVTLAFARAAQREGVAFATEHRVVSIRRGAPRFVVDVQSAVPGSLAYGAATDKLLIASGAWTASVGALANLHLPVFPAPLTMNVTERWPSFINHLVQHVGRRLSVKQAHAGNVLIGGGWRSRMAQAKGGGFDLEQSPLIDPETLRENLRTACDVIPGLGQLNLLRTWTGLASITPDHFSMLGETPAAPGLYVAAGGAGFSLGPTFGRLLSELILTGRTSEPIDLYDPARFGALNSFMGP